MWKGKDLGTCNSNGCYDRPETCFDLKSRTADRETDREMDRIIT
jgi:hypothetical protein